MATRSRGQSLTTKMETLPMVAYHRRRWLLIPRRCRKSGPQGALHEPVAQGSQLSSARITTDWRWTHIRLASFAYDAKCHHAVMSSCHHAVKKKRDMRSQRNSI